MRVVFMGTPQFAVPSLLAVAEHHEVRLVVTRPDRVAGRGSGLRPSEVKDAALRMGIPVYEGTTLKGEGAGPVAEIAPDVICVAAFGMLLPPEVLAIPRYGCINVHASLLPRYRGAAPLQRAILSGDAETGVSIMRMESGLDTGPWARQVRVAVGSRYLAEIEEEIACVGASALVDVLGELEAGSVIWTAQDDELATYAEKVTKDHLSLDPAIGTEDALRRVRASSRRSPARACLGEREVTVVRARRAGAPSAPGTVYAEAGEPALGLIDGGIVLEVVRPAGKGDMSGEAWARGARLESGTSWRCTR